jgi:hypothetical protein
MWDIMGTVLSTKVTSSSEHRLRNMLTVLAVVAAPTVGILLVGLLRP